MTDPAHPARSLNVLLLVGIIALPLIFSWFLLRQGYRRSTRIAAFSYGIVMFVITLSGRVLA